MMRMMRLVSAEERDVSMKSVIYEAVCMPPYDYFKQLLRSEEANSITYFKKI